jgi:hypothetical protein
VQNRPFFFELHDLLLQFLAAVDDVTIGRHNKNREEKEHIKVRYINASKERVLFDIVNKAHNITLPVVAVNVTSLQRDESRVFNKILGMDLPIKRNEYGKLSQHIGMPVPVNVGVSMNILASFQSDLDQIISNFVPNCNPYVIISWKLPEQFGLEDTQEIRSEVLWDGNINYEYPTDIDASNKTRFIGSTTFVIKGWLFPAVPIDPVKNIFFIDANFHTTSKILLNSLEYATLTAEEYNYDPNKALLNETEYVHISAFPQITNIFRSTSAGAFEITQEEYTVSSQYYKTPFLLYGKFFNYLDNIVLSSNSVSLNSSLTALQYTYYPTISGYIIPKELYTVIDENSIYLSLSGLSGTGNFDLITTNEVGWSTTQELSTELSYI